MITALVNFMRKSEADPRCLWGKKTPVVRGVEQIALLVVLLVLLLLHISKCSLIMCLEVGIM